MNLKIAFHIWQYLKLEFRSNARTRSMHVLNLKREFESQRMKDSKIVKEYVDRLLEIMNKLRLLREDMLDSRIVEKILVTLPERFEAKISMLEEVRDLLDISLTELLNTLQAQERRRQIREDGSVEGTMQAKLQLQDSGKSKKKRGKKNKGNPCAGAGNNSTSRASRSGAVGNKGGNYLPCKHYGRANHPHFRCWSILDAKCSKCNQMGHVDKICKNKGNQLVNETQAVHQEEEEELFVTSCYANSSSVDTWLVDSGCKNHMSNNVELFKDLDKTAISKVRVENGDYISMKGKGSVAIESISGTKIITDVLYVLDIDQNLLSVGQLLEKGFKVCFENRSCIIKDAKGLEVFTIKMKEKSFPHDLMEEEHSAHQAFVKATDL